MPSDTSADDRDRLRDVARQLLDDLDAVDEGATWYDKTGSMEKCGPAVLNASESRQRLRELLKLEHATDGGER